MHIRSRLPLVSVALVRVGGGALTFGGVAVGIRSLGASEFGASIVLLALGVGMALPVTCSERLVLRLAAQSQEQESLQFVTLSKLFACAAGLIGITVSGILLARGSDGWLAPLAVASATTSWSVSTSVQSYLRGTGHLLWGQVPNELVRPAATVMAYPIAAQFPQYSASLAVIIPSLVMIIVMTAAPTAKRTRLAPNSTFTTAGRQLRPFLGFMIIAIVAMIIERAFPVLTGAFSDNENVSFLTLALRVIQLGLFGQALALFYFSPQIAREVPSGGVGLTASLRKSLRNIRLLSAVCALPVLTAVTIFPRQLAVAVGGESFAALDPSILRWGAVAVVAQLATGPAQALLTLSRHEGAVAKTYALGCVVGLAVFALSPTRDAPAASRAIAATYVFLAFGQLFATHRIYKART